MKAGAYVLHLNCDHADGCRRRDCEFAGETKKEAFAKARDAGWAIGESWTAPDYCKAHKPLKK